MRALEQVLEEARDEEINDYGPTETTVGVAEGRRRAGEGREPSHREADSEYASLHLDGGLNRRRWE